jgi:hypothetical protein
MQIAEGMFWFKLDFLFATLAEMQRSLNSIFKINQKKLGTVQSNLNFGN